jgi:hypothetical protein
MGADGVYAYYKLREMTKMAELSIKVEEVREALKIVKGVQVSTRELLGLLKEIQEEVTPKLSFDDLMELKDSVYKFKTGDLVSCNWGGQFKIGFIIDPIVRYNGYMRFSKKHSEKAAIVRFFEKSSTGYNYSNHEVVPYREIAKVVDIQKGIVNEVTNPYQITVDFVEGSHKGLKNHRIYCNDVYSYSIGDTVEIFHTKDVMVRENKDAHLDDLWSVDKFYAYQPWQDDEKKRTKISGYEL